MTETDMLAYYASRAAEYERIYHKPERQPDLARLRTLLPELLAGQDVLEIACGTGWWTEAVAPAVRSILATDANEEVLAIARTKSYPPGRVRFRVADAYDLSDVVAAEAPPGGFTAGLAAFWWSHVPRQDLPRFLAGFHAALAPGGRVVFLDNRYVEGSSTPISRTDEFGNTYQLRRLDDGTEHEVMKNFPSEEELRAAICGGAGGGTCEFEYYWCLWA